MAREKARRMTRASRESEEHPRRQTLHVDPRLLDAAKSALGLTSDDEAVRVALERVVAGCQAANRRAAAGLRVLGGRRMFDASRIAD